MNDDVQDITLSAFLQRRFGGDLLPIKEVKIREGTIGAMTDHTYDDCVRLHLPVPVQMEAVSEALMQYCTAVAWSYFDANVSDGSLAASIHPEDGYYVVVCAFYENPLNSNVLCINLISPLC